MENLRFLKQAHVLHSQRLLKDYIRDAIHSYGIDTIYFRRFEDYFQVSGQSNMTYGEDASAVYNLSADLIVYAESVGDSFLMSQFGIESAADMVVNFTIDDFNEKFRDTLGVEVTNYFSSTMTAEISAGQFVNDVVSGLVSNNDVSGIVSGYLPEIASDVSISEPFNILPKVVNPDIKAPNFYKYDDIESSGTLDGILTMTVDASGNGFATGTLSGNITYNTKPSEVSGLGFKDISPQVGDFWRIYYDQGEVFEEYEITRIHDRNLQSDGLNPLMGKYSWRCDCTRREYSHETVLPNDIQSEPTSTKEVYNGIHEDISNEIFDYDDSAIDDIDDVNSDDVYGAY